MSWIPGRGFVQEASGAAGRAKASYLAGPQHKRPQPTRPGGQGGGQGDPDDDDIRQYRSWQGQRSQWSNLGTGRVWRDYAELSGIPVDFNRQQYNFHDVHPRSSPAKRRQNVQEGPSEEDKKTQQSVETGEFDLRPPQLALGPSTQKALDPGAPLREGYTTSPRVTPMGPQSWEEPKGEIGMGSGKIRPTRGMAPRGMNQSRQNIINPVQGNTAASMVTSADSVIDVPSWEKKR